MLSSLIFTVCMKSIHLLFLFLSLQGLNLDVFFFFFLDKRYFPLFLCFSIPLLNIRTDLSLRVA